MAVTRILSAEDAEELASVLRANREFLAPWDVRHEASYFTAAGQRAGLERALDGYARDAMVPLAIIEGDGRLVGRVTINTIVRGAFQSADVGYWLSQASNGRGLATAAVTDAIAIAFGQLGLHRLQAATLLHNARSQRVLRRAGFRPFAVAPDYLKIAGQWQDHILFHLVNPAG
ncbi:MAG TPA: GNAT family protein [Trebonia sp.]|nr:GNAT family protein [Trebonia sp.]